MKSLFLHCWHSVPGGVKPTDLKDYGPEVLSPAGVSSVGGTGTAGGDANGLGEVESAMSQPEVTDMELPICHRERDRPATKV